MCRGHGGVEVAGRYFKGAEKRGNGNGQSKHVREF